MRIIIEPHADDAFLSLGGHIEKWAKEGKSPTTIVTVYSGTRKRGRDASSYAAAVRASWTGLGAKEPDDEGQPGEGSAALRAGLEEVVQERAASDALGRLDIIVPLGIKHQEHKEVRSAVEAMIVKFRKMQAGLFYFLDQPYAATQSNGAEVEGLIQGRHIESYLKPHARKYRHVPLFKDQAKFFYYNPPEKLVGNVEMIVY